MTLLHSVVMGVFGLGFGACSDGVGVLLLVLCGFAPERLLLEIISVSAV